MWDQVKSKKRFKSYDYEKLKEVYRYVHEDEPPVISTEELRDWARKHHINVSIHAYDSAYRKFLLYSNNYSSITLVYI